jgi:serine/threonine protein kinase
LNEPAEDEDRAYVEFVRRLLDDMAAGRSHPAAYYERLFPECAERVRAEVPAAGPPDAFPAPPARIGAYDVVGELPAGGMGRLLLARRAGKEGTLVIKTAKGGVGADESQVLDRLRREATILGRLDHERICPVIDVVSEGERVFVVMPFIEGETLEARIRRARAKLEAREPAEAAWSAIAAGGSSEDGLDGILALMEDVALAVHAAHELGIVHRDLKPGNIMVRADGHAVVLDFGLAVDLSDRQARRLTVQGDVLGTPSYMAPEQIEGEIASIDRRTDVYALGAILYEILTFRRAFEASGADALKSRILARRAAAPRHVNPAVPSDLEAVCAKAMEAAPGRRYATARALAEDLRRVRSREPALAATRSLFARVAAAARRNRIAVAIAGALVLAALAVVLVLARS